MEVSFEVRLEEDYKNALGVLTTLATGSAAFTVRFLTNDNDKNSVKPIYVCEHYKKQWHTKNQCWKLPGCLQESTSSTASQTKTPTLCALTQSGHEVTEDDWHCPT
ncbi:uncharacterized protein E5676_scaffold190G00050 [Cucumis melo var. makuwa]|uniref:Uncharacterized protein n=1 Tax=Cucumis melo var. makuwa TaxID=1194695 RepID=A0A5D3DQH3_CUCMM|nr:uncharacterized protein E6C27_scaffold25G00870 [Cucumis melo var. makuwa]TYK25916.1 uncharacterized protein E5676_scaffold190G00050 [Cucumis melo var. makuwa]